MTHTRGGPPAAKETRGWRGVGEEGRDPVGEGAGRERVRGEGCERSLKDVQMCDVQMSETGDRNLGRLRGIYKLRPLKTPMERTHTIYLSYILYGIRLISSYVPTTRQNSNFIQSA